MTAFLVVLGYLGLFALGVVIGVTLKEFQRSLVRERQDRP